MFDVLLKLSCFFTSFSFSICNFLLYLLMFLLEKKHHHLILVVKIINQVRGIWSWHHVSLEACKWGGLCSPPLWFICKLCFMELYVKRGGGVRAVWTQTRSITLAASFYVEYQIWCTKHVLTKCEQFLCTLHSSENVLLYIIVDL